MREPFFRKQTQCWYVKDMAGRFIRLDPDKDTAFELWHKLQSAQIFEGDNATVGGLIDAFLAEIDGSVSPARLDVLVYYTSLFSNSHGSDLVSSVRPSLVSRWLIYTDIRWRRTHCLRGNLRQLWLSYLDTLLGKIACWSCLIDHRYDCIVWSVNF